MITETEREEIRSIQRRLKQLRGMAAIIESDAQALWDRMMELDEALIDRMYPQGVESKELRGVPVWDNDKKRYKGEQ